VNERAARLQHPPHGRGDLVPVHLMERRGEHHHPKLVQAGGQVLGAGSARRG
jgi:hypothetical protein